MLQWLDDRDKERGRDGKCDKEYIETVARDTYGVSQE